MSNIKNRQDAEHPEMIQPFNDIFLIHWFYHRNTDKEGVAKWLI